MHSTPDTVRQRGWIGTRGAPVPLHYAIAIFSVGISALWPAAWSPLWLDGPLPVVLLLAILVSTWLGGTGPGLAATVLAAVSASAGWLMQPASERVGIGGLLVTLGALVAGGLVVSARRQALQFGEVPGPWEPRAGRSDGPRLSTTSSEGAAAQLTPHMVDQGAAAILTAIVETSEDAIVSKDLDSNVWSWNRGAERIFGYSASEMVGRSIRTIIPKDRWQEEDDVIARLRQGLRVEHFETIRRRKDGSEVYVSVAISPIRTSDGTVIGASKIARDITERRRAETARAEMLERERQARMEIEHASRIKDDFLAMLSHELRTPLNAVMGYTQLLMTGAVEGAELTHAYQAIQRNAQAQVRLVDSLLDLSRILAGKLDLQTETLDLSAVIGLAVEALRPAALKKNLTVQVRGGSDVRVFGDAARLQQVFWNLLANATKFTPAGGRIVVRVHEDADDVEVRVEDTGRGIPASLLPRVFDRFAQADGESRRAQSGIGLGLALVRELVTAHGGTVTAESPGEGQGATFIVRLPSLLSGRQETVARSARVPGAEPAPAGSREPTSAVGASAGSDASTPS